jgi:acyl carrier protein
MDDAMDDTLRAHIAHRDDTLARVRRVLIENLKVPLEPDEIDLDAPLFGTGLGLDSVDAVELVVAIESEFALRIPEGTGGPWALRTVHALVEFVIELQRALAELHALAPGAAAAPPPAGPEAAS